MTSQGRLQAPNIELEPFSEYLAQFASLHPGTTRISLELPIAVNLEEGAPERFTLSEGKLELRNVDLRIVPDGQPLLAMDTISVRGIDLRLDQRFAAVASVGISNGKAIVERSKDGTFLVTELADLPSPDDDEEDEDTSWSYGIGEISISGLALLYVDRGFDNVLEYPATIDQLTVRDFSTNLEEPGFITLSGTAGGSGRYQLEGYIAPQPIHADMAVNIQELSLKPLDAVLAAFTTLRTINGELHIEGRLGARGIEDSEDPPVLAFTGNAGISRLQIAESPEDPPLLNIETIVLEELRVNSQPVQLTAALLHLESPSLFGIFENNTLNWLQLMPGSPKEEREAEELVEESLDTQVTIDQIVLRDGGVVFEDRTQNPVVRQQLTRLQVLVENFTLHEMKEVTAQVTASVQEVGALEANARWQAQDPLRWTDFDAVISDYRLPPLSPYMVEITGRTIVSGELSLNLNYEIREAQLEGEQGISLAQFEFGPQINENPIIDLPVDLGVSLLRDLEHRIEVDVPISGNLNDPNFSYWDTILTAFNNLLERAVTKPFRVIGDAFGEDDDDLSFVTFDAGSSTLNQEQRHKLQTLGRALRERPDLTLYYTSYLTENDRIAYSKQLLREQLQAFQADHTVEDQPEGFLDLDDPEDYGKVLSRYYLARQAESGGGLPDAQEALRKQEEAEEADDSPVFWARLFGATDSAAEKADDDDPRTPPPEEMEAALRAEIDVTDQDLVSLRRAREEAVSEYVIHSGLLDQDRVQPLPEDATAPQAPEDRPAVVFSFQ